MTRQRSLLTLGTLALSLGLAMPVAAADGPPPPPPPGGAKAPPPPPPGGAGGAPPPPPAPAAQATADSSGTGLVGDAEAKYKAGEYEAAAIQFYKIAYGEIPSNPADQQRAQYNLGKTLYKLGFFSASLQIFDEIVAQGAAHPFHKLTLPWLASLSRELPEGAGVLEKVGTYDPQSLEDEAFDEVRDELYYLLGRFYYHKGDLGQGIALLGQVPQNSDYYIPAQFFLGVSYTREFQAEPAVEAFKAVLRRSIQLREAAAAEKKAAKKKKKEAAAEVKLSRRQRRLAKKNKTSVELSFEEEMRNYEHMASFGMANIFYALGRFDTATKYLDSVPLESPYWLDAVQAAAWTEFRKVEVDPDNANSHYQRTLGYVHTLNAPFFEEYLYPDALKLKAVTYYFNCRYDSAKRTVDEFNRRYPNTKDQLQDILNKAPEDFQLFELAVKVRNQESDLDPFAEEVARKSLQDKTLEKYFAYVLELEREITQFEEMSGEFKGASVGERVVEDLDAALSLAKEAAGGQSRQRLTAQIKEIKDLQREMIKVEYEILEKRKQQGKLEEIPDKPLKPTVDNEHEIYNYNGEYWQDELGYYRYKINSLCKE